MNENLLRRCKQVSIGLAILTVTVIWVSRPAPVLGQLTSWRVLGQAYVAVGESVYYLDTNNFPYGWKLLPIGTLTLPPIPVSSMVSYDGDRVITDTGEGWGRVGGVWTNLGTIPGTPTIEATWGQVKARYR